MINDKRKFSMIAAGIILIILAVVIAVYNYYCNARAAENIQSIISSIETITPSDNVILQVQKQSKKIPDSGKYSELPSLEINGSFYIGILKISSLNLVLPVLSNYSAKNLDIAPCRCNNSNKYNNSKNLIIEGRNYASHFGQLGSLTAGDQIIFTDSLGKIYNYEVSKLSTVSKHEKVKNLAGDRELVLFCDVDFGFRRLAVFCSPI